MIQCDRFYPRRSPTTLKGVTYITIPKKVTFAELPPAEGLIFAPTGPLSQRCRERNIHFLPFHVSGGVLGFLTKLPISVTKVSMKLQHTKVTPGRDWWTLFQLASNLFPRNSPALLRDYLTTIIALYGFIKALFSGRGAGGWHFSAKKQGLEAFI